MKCVLSSMTVLLGLVMFTSSTMATEVRDLTEERYLNQTVQEELEALDFWYQAQRAAILRRAAGHSDSTETIDGTSTGSITDEMGFYDAPES